MEPLAQGWALRNDLLMHAGHATLIGGWPSTFQVSLRPKVKVQTLPWAPSPFAQPHWRDCEGTGTSSSMTPWHQTMTSPEPAFQGMKGGWAAITEKKAKGFSDSACGLEIGALNWDFITEYPPANTDQFDGKHSLTSAAIKACPHHRLIFDGNNL